jgi:hypothetical protein
MTRGGPPTLGVGVGLTNPHLKKLVCYERLIISSEWDRFFG